jgi:heme/copper-type cytochrome/quinol oxidase subunit 1
MFATPLPELGQGLFTASSLMIVIPNGVQMFCWIATLWGSEFRVFERPQAVESVAYVLAGEPGRSTYGCQGRAS